MDLSGLFWKASVSDMKHGYIFDQDTDSFICLVCGRQFVKGIVYPHGDLLLETQKAASTHLSEDHTSMFHFMIDMNKQYTGLTDIQRDLMELFYAGTNDKEIAEKMGMGSTSTVRNHRFKLREKQKQAKVFLALMELLEENDNHAEEFVQIHRGAKMVDDRFAITEQERERALKSYFEGNEDGPLNKIPSKEKRKIIVLQILAKRFEAGRTYGEKEVNEILKAANEDFASLRRYMVDYGFLERSRDCTKYKLKL